MPVAFLMVCCRQGWLGRSFAAVRDAARGSIERDRVPSSGSDRFSVTWQDLLLMGVITAAAAALRLWGLDRIPLGLHGDEGFTGLDAWRVQDEGWIGPYVESARGQPAGPLYWAALVLWVFGDGVYQVRLSMALLGLVTIPAAYLCFGVLFGRRVAILGSVLFAFSLWHLHYSRLAFMVISWPLLEVVALTLLFLALRRGSWALFLLAGLALGAGVYAYNGHPLFLVGVGLFLAGLAVVHLCRRSFLFLAQSAAMGVAAVLVALPLILYAADGDNDYFSHHRYVSLFESPQYKEATTFPDKVGLLADRTRDYLTGVLWEAQPDGVDGAGARVLLDPISAALAVVGLLMFLRGWRDPARALVLLMVVLLPLGAILTVDGAFRRTLGLVPFVTVLAAAPLAAAWRAGDALRTPWRDLAYGGVVLALVLVGLLNLHFYFARYPDTATARWVFPEVVTKAAEYLKDLPSGTYVYFYSERWSYGYATRRYLAPDVQGENRAKEFSERAARYVETHGEPYLQLNREGDVAYVFLDSYLDLLPQVEARYPGGQAYEAHDSERRALFRSYLLFDERGGQR